MKRFFSLFFLLTALPAYSLQSIVVLPFSNHSETQHVYWLGEGFAESLSEELLLQDVYVIPRSKRKAVFDELKLPYTGDLSRAVMLKIGQTLPADYLVFGWYSLKDQKLDVEVHVIRLATSMLSAPIHASGQLDQLYQIQTALRDGLNKYFATQKLTTARPNVTQKQVPLHAYELYIKGLLEPNETERVKFFQRAIEANPQYPQAVLRLSRSLFALHRYQESDQHLQSAAFSEPLYAPAEFLKGLNSYFLGNHEKAIRIWLELSKKNPAPEVLNNIGLASIKRNDIPSAILYLTRSVELEPKNADYRFNLASSFALASDPANATIQYREVVRLRPNDYQALGLLLKLAEKQGSPVVRKLQQIFQEKLPSEQKGKFPEQYSNVAQLIRPSLFFVSSEEKQYVDAATEKVRQQQLRYVEAYQTSARKYLEEDEPDKAVIDIRKALGMVPLDWYLHYLWGWAYVLKEDTSAAIAQLEMSIWCKDNVESHLILAELYRRAEKYADAKLQVQQSLALDPENKKALDIWNKIWDKVPSKNQKK